METRVTTFTSPRFVNKPVLADVEFLDELQRVDDFAAKNELIIVVTSSARQQGVPIGGAIVPPASRSNHLVGHAIDMNVKLDGRLFNGDDLANPNSLPAPIQQFIGSIRNDPVLRWGGDFDDPVHIDDGLNLRLPGVWDAKFPIIQTGLHALVSPQAAPGEPRLLQLTTPLMRGKDVLKLQQALIAQKFLIDDDGVFGPGTDAAVTAFQKNNNLTADGIVGLKTRAALGI